MNDWSARRQVTLICGASSTGKTTFALRYLANREAKVRFIFDGEDAEFSHRLGVPSARSAMEMDVGALRGWCAWDPTELFPGARENAFSFWSEWVGAWAARLYGHKVVLVDEVQRYCTPTAIPREFRALLDTGRRRNLEVVAITNQPSQVNGAFWQQVTEIVTFQCGANVAVDKLAEYGFDPQEVARLPLLHWISRTIYGGEIRGVIRH